MRPLPTTEEELRAFACDIAATFVPDLVEVKADDRIMGIVLGTAVAAVRLTLREVTGLTERSSETLDPASWRPCSK